MANRKILIAGGGTGGHLFPALAIGDELQIQNSNIFIHYIALLALYNHHLNLYASII